MPGRLSNSPLAMASLIFSSISFSKDIFMPSSVPRPRAIRLLLLDRFWSPKAQADKFPQVLRNKSGRCYRENGHPFQDDPVPHRPRWSRLYHDGSIRAVEIGSRAAFEIRDVEAKDDDVEIRR